MARPIVTKGIAVKDAIRIGGGSGFWGDSADGPVQLVRKALLVRRVSQVLLDQPVRLDLQDPREALVPWD